jgi:hypothetical protein
MAAAGPVKPETLGASTPVKATITLSSRMVPQYDPQTLRINGPWLIQRTLSAGIKAAVYIAAQRHDIRLETDNIHLIEQPLGDDQPEALFCDVKVVINGSATHDRCESDINGALTDEVEELSDRMGGYLRLDHMPIIGVSVKLRNPESSQG